MNAIIRYAQKAQLDAEKNNSAYGQYIRGARESIAPVMRNFTSQENTDRFQQLSQPEQNGVVNTGARMAGNIVPYLPFILGTGYVAGPTAAKFAAAVPQGTTTAGTIASGAAKGAIQSAPYGWMSGLPYAKTGDERGQNIINGTLGNMLLGALFGGGTNALKMKLNPPKEEQGRFPSGRYAPNKKTPAQAREKVAEAERKRLGKKPNETVYITDLAK